MFKRDIKKYSSFAEILPKLVILSKVEELLDRQENVGLLVYQRADEIVIGPEPDQLRNRKTFTIDDTEPIQQDQTVTEVIADQEEVQEFFEEYVEEHFEDEKYSMALEDTIVPHQETNRKEIENMKTNYTSKSETEESLASEPLSSKRQKNKKYKYRINTNDQLSDEEKQWINEQVRNCSVVRKGQLVYKCPKCDTILQISGSFKKHLRDNHILKSDEELQLKNSRQEFKTEIKQSKIEVDMEEGPVTVWKCQRCKTSRVFRSEAGLKVHIRYNHIKCQFIDAKFVAQCKVTVNESGCMKDAWKCPECNKILRSRDGLRNHIKLEHPDAVASTSQNNTRELFANSVSINQGNDEMNDVVNILGRNKRTLQVDSSFSNTCLECGIQFVNKTTRKDKSCRIHHECHKILNVLSQYYQLSKCEESRIIFTNDNDLDTFLQTDPQQFQPIPCEGMTANVSQKFKEPIGNADEDDPEAWKCGHCGAKYQTDSDCNGHIIILHSKKFICPVDYLEFEGNRGMSQFNAHMKNKHPELFPDMPFYCTYCRAEFSSIFDKLAHMKLCDEKKFECDHCSKKYFTKTELVRHLRIVSGDIAFVCDICSKTCASTMDLKLHRTSHSNLKSYVCSYPECSKAFKTPAARSSHMETHSNVTYTCSYCPSNFKKRALLQRHLRKGFCKGLRNSVKPQESLDEIYTDSQIYEVNEVSN